MKKIMGITAAVLLTALLLAGCNGKSGSGEGQASVPAADNPYGVKRISETPITLKIFSPKSAEMPPFDQLEHFKKYSEYTNVNVIWEQTTFDQQAERFNIILASGDLPDMFWDLNNNQNAMVTLRSANAIIPLQKYLKDAPNFQKVVQENPETVKAFMEPDGNVWFMPLFDGLAANDPTILRGDWLEKLNLPLPVTRDDWLAYWKGVRDNDMNGNGDAADEVPLSAVSSTGFRTWVSAFGMLDGFYVDVKDGNKVKYSNVDPRYREFLTWANMLWNENILDKEFASINGSNFSTKNGQNIIGSYRGKLNGNFNTYMATLPGRIPGYKVYGTEPVKAADGSQLHPGVANFVRYDTIGGVVTASSKYPAEAVQFCDWFYSFSAPYGGGFMNIFGLEGITFEFTADGKDYNYTDYVLKNPDKLSTTSALSRYTTRNQHPGYVPPTGSFKMWNPLTVETYSRIEPFYKDSLQYKCENLPFTDAENKEIRSKMADISTYVDETINKFIMGREPLANFDRYAATVKSMGMDDVLKIYNDAYARWNSPRPGF